MLIDSGTRTYDVAGTTAEANSYRLRLARVTASDSWCLLQVAKDRRFNGGLSRASYILSELARTSAEYDEVYARDHGGKTLHYDRLFPTKLETFLTSEEHGRRRVNALTFTDITDVPRLLSLSVPRVKYNRVLDLKTGAWILGRLLKLLGFVHPQGIAIRALGPGNVLLDTSQHFAVVLDWSTAQVFQSEVPPEADRTDIARVAQTILQSCGIDTNAPYSWGINEAEERYMKLLRELAEGKVGSATEAHRRFYQLVRETWETEFHPFTTLPL